MMIFSSIALILKKTCGASCKKIGIADKSIAQGILLTLKQQIVRQNKSHTQFVCDFNKNLKCYAI